MIYLRFAVISIIVSMVLLVVAGVAFTGKVILDGMGRDPTVIAFRYANHPWKNGNMLETGRRWLNFTQVAIEGGLRWQVASYHLNRTATFQSEGRLSEAVDECLTARNALGAYDNNNEVNADCTDLYWATKGY